MLAEVARSVNIADIAQAVETSLGRDTLTGIPQPLQI